LPRLLIHVEGETEEVFVNEVLGRRLLDAGYERVGARLLGNARLRERRGGIRGWDVVKRDITRHLLEDRGSLSTTIVDYYALPHDGPKAWPGRAEASALPPAQKATHVERALLADLATDLGTGFDQRRFLPFVVMHEFEGLLFSDCEAFARGAGQPAIEGQLREIRNQFNTPEDINDKPATAPSRRVEAVIHGYAKPLHGNLAALEVGLDRITTECPHFRTWILELEARATLQFA
jgi:hypothetical protein